MSSQDAEEKDGSDTAMVPAVKTPLFPKELKSKDPTAVKIACSNMADRLGPFPGPDSPIPIEACEGRAKKSPRGRFGVLGVGGPFFGGLRKGLTWLWILIGLG